jgi:hypothetical protein
MKKVSLLIFALFITTSALFAQDVAFGIKGGLNLSSLKIDDPEATYNARTGFHAGFFLRGKFDKVGIQPEFLLYTQKGEFSGPAYTGEENFSYITVPVLVKFYPLSGLNIHAGPQFGFLIDGDRTTNVQILGTIKEDIKDEYKSTDIAISVGAGWDFGFGLSIDARYNIGVQDINEAEEGETTKSRVFLVSLGWNFLK